MNSDEDWPLAVQRVNRAFAAVAVARFHAFDLALDEGASWHELSSAVGMTRKELQDWYFSHLRFRDVDVDGEFARPAVDSWTPSTDGI